MFDRHVRFGAASAAVFALVGLNGCLQTPPLEQESSSANSTDALAAGFATPPSEARPRVWWHWMNGNVTKDGVEKDLNWLSRVGVGGVQNFDADLATPLIVDTRLSFMSPEWKDTFRHAVSVADDLGLEFAIAASPGWSQTGGPWVPPQDGMKKLVWSETIIEGGQRFSGTLPPPPRATGQFQDAQRNANELATPGSRSFEYYADVGAVAYRLPDSAMSLPTPRAFVGGDVVDGNLFGDSSLMSSINIPVGTEADPASVVLDYGAPVKVRTATLAGGTMGYSSHFEVETPAGWERVSDFDAQDTPQSTISFNARTSRRFRVIFVPVVMGPPNPQWGPSAPGAQIGELGQYVPAQHISVREFRLSSEPKVNHFEVKASFGVAGEYYDLDTGLADEPGVPTAAVIDLTDRLQQDGRLEWTPPSGRWRVLRLGYSLTGVTNHPATLEATGLEVDKLDAAAVRRYLETYLSLYREATGPDLLGKQGLNALLTDSIETGPANWSPALLDDFERLRGYDARPWLPTLTGAVIGSRAESDAFLYDFRRTLSDLLSSAHYGTIADVAHENDLTVYGEALEGIRGLLGDDISMRRYADVPMAALWNFDLSKGPDAGYIGDIKGAASVANIYGRKFVAAESLTSANSPWDFAPRDLKPVIDLEFATGVNRPVIHTSVHQPLDTFVPGVSLAIFGQYFNRHDTWAEMAKPWIDYISRSAFMLQQGRNVADVAYFVGEERPSAVLFRANAVPDLPRTYGYDLVNAEALIDQLSMNDGSITATGGARYKAIYLGGDSEKMTVPVLRKLASLAQQGAIIIGHAPVGSPSLADSKAEFDTLIDQLWSGQAVTSVGRGRVIASGDIEMSLKAAGIESDFAYQTDDADHAVLFLHRKIEDGDIYFLTNRENSSTAIEARFRVTGKAPEIWRAETGASEPVSYRIENGVTIVPLTMNPHDAFFVVFRRETTAQTFVAPSETWKELGTLEGGWDVSFQPGRGAPASARFDKLSSLSEHAIPGIKYFSGIATYRTTFDLPALDKGRQVRIDLGAVGDVAEVYVNDVFAGTVWNEPGEVDVTASARRGRNELEIRVANRWVNRLIGDAQPGATKLTQTTVATYRPDAPLRPSGLMGPVRILTNN